VRITPTSAVELLARPLLHRFRHAGLGDLFLELFDVLAARLDLAQLFFDRLQLLAQEELALAGVDLLLHVRLDLALQLQQVQLLGEQLVDPLQALGRVEHLQQLLAGGGVQVHRRGNQVGKSPRRLDVHRRDVGIFR
jgi:hypothetical protein